MIALFYAIPGVKMNANPFFYLLSSEIVQKIVLRLASTFEYLCEV